MKKIIIKVALVAIALLTLGEAGLRAEKAKTAIPSPDGTYLYAQKDTCSLYMDVYEPVSEATKYADGKEKPTIIFMFGGGFVGGERNWSQDVLWFDSLRKDGYRVISIDYRLGLKGQKKMGISSVDALDKAIHLAVEDLFSATSFIVDNASEFGVDPKNIVISGSSAGAISVLQAEFEIANSTSYAAALPKDFNYAGVVAFSGAILTREGALKYASAPCPMLLFHGTEDNVVKYTKIRFFNLGWYGADSIASVCEDKGYNYSVYRFLGHRHEIANSEARNKSLMEDFLETNVSGGVKRIIDAKVSDPRIELSTLSLDELYK